MPVPSDFSLFTACKFYSALRTVSNLEEKSKDLASQMFSSGLFVVHDSTRGCHDDVTELTRRQKIVGPLLNFANTNIESWGDDTDFVEATSQVDNNFTATVIINDLKFADITMLHHDFEETNDNF